MKSRDIADDDGSFDFIATFRENYNSNIQLSPHQTQLIGAAIRTRAPGCRMLVFGAGHDTPLWLSLNKDGHTVILETSDKWAEVACNAHPDALIELMSAQSLTVAQSLEVTVDEIKSYRPPHHLANQEWDVILVDAPPGYKPTDPGRAIAIAWAYHLAGPGTHVFIDDYERAIERKFADALIRGRANSASYVIQASDTASHRLLLWSSGVPTQHAQFKGVVLCVADEAYAKRWRFCIDSHARYCRRHTYQHCVIDPRRSQLNAKWAKLEFAAQYLNQSSPVLLLDADTEIATACPPFTDIMTEDSDIYVVNGISGRPNSGVMMFSAYNNGVASSFLDECLATRSSRVPAEDFVTEDGENGHVINTLKRARFASRTKILDRSWNCSDPSCADTAYIRHYTNRLRKWHETKLPLKSADRYAAKTKHAANFIRTIGARLRRRLRG